MDRARPIPYFYDELGPIENLTVAFLIAAIICLLAAARRGLKSMVPLDKAVLLTLVLGSVYFAGEELSWGQHLFGFSTPENYSALNHQQEMNLHNLKGVYRVLFDRLPRTLITLGMIVGGVILPFFPEKAPLWIRRYIPGKESVFTCVLALTVSLPDKLVTWVTNRPKTTFTNGGEMKELYIALFILLFSLHFIRRAAPRPARPADVPEFSSPSRSS